MHPWAIIGDLSGWAIIGGVLWIAAIPLLGVAERLIAHYRTRSTRPAAGQIWQQGKARLHVRSVSPNGARIWLETAGPMSRVSWSDTPEQWAVRVRIRRLFLIKE